MRVLARASVLCASALAISACANGHSGRAHSATTDGTKTDAIQLHESIHGSLSEPLRELIHSTIRDGSPDGTVHEIDVYGPGSRAALVRASSGAVVVQTPRQRKQPFYLVVLHGEFVCQSCTGPAGAKPPRGTIETRVWSPTAGGLDFGIGNSLPAAVSRFHRLAVITLS